jgi:uncharacterized LabA/DUF88 family protein
MKAMKAAMTGSLNTLILLAGDGDFHDMVQFLKEDMAKKVWIFGYKESISPNLYSAASPGCVVFLQDIWEGISIPL